MSKKRQYSWKQIELMDQPTFWAAMVDMYQGKTGATLTYKLCAEITFMSHSRFQKWFTSGSAQQKLPQSTRHHIYLAINSSKMPQKPKLCSAENR